MSINFPSNPSNNQIFVANNGTNWIFSNTKNVWSVVSQSTYQVAVTTANTWSNPNTGNTFGAYQVSGITQIETAPITQLTYNTIWTSTEYYGYNVATDTTNSELNIPRSPDANIDNILYPIFQGRFLGGYWKANVAVNGIVFAQYWNFNNGANSTHYFINYGDTEVLFSSGDTVTLTLDYRRSQPWFDPAELGFTNFKGAQLNYQAYISGANGYSEIGQAWYIRPRFRENNQYRDTYAYVNLSQNSSFPIVSLNQTDPGSFSDFGGGYATDQSPWFLDFDYENNSDNKIYYTNYDHPNDVAFIGNVVVQYIGTVWTSSDR